MLRLLADEDLRGAIVRGLFLRQPDLDIVRAQDVGLSGAPDPDVLTWAAENGRVIITHDRNTMPAFAYERVNAGVPMPGLFVVSRRLSVGTAIEDILLVASASIQGEHENCVYYLPL